MGAYGYYRGRYTDGLNLHVDYLRHFYGIFGNASHEAYSHMPLYVGVGGMLSSPDVAGVRGAMGVTWLFDQAPFDVSFDLAPTLLLGPAAGFDVDAELGGRFYF